MGLNAVEDKFYTRLHELEYGSNGSGRHTKGMDIRNLFFLNQADQTENVCKPLQERFTIRQFNNGIAAALFNLNPSFFIFNSSNQIAARLGLPVYNGYIGQCVGLNQRIGILPLGNKKYMGSGRFQVVN